MSFLATTKTSKASNGSKPKSQSRKSAATPKSAATSAPSRAEQARSAAESAVDVPVGVVLEVSDRVTELVEPFSGRNAAEKQLKSYGTSLRRTVKRSERRGASARRKASTEARKTRNKVEREARRTVKRNRAEVEQRVRKVSDQLAALRA
jgi:uncharacterized protein YfcZ (UPF0381/DUF406 family)